MHSWVTDQGFDAANRVSRRRPSGRSRRGIRSVMRLNRMNAYAFHRLPRGLIPPGTMPVRMLVNNSG